MDPTHCPNPGSEVWTCYVVGYGTKSSKSVKLNNTEHHIFPVLADFLYFAADIVSNIFEILLYVTD